MKKNIMFCLLILLLSNTAFALTIYVSNTGSDDNNGLTKDKPLKTLARAVERVEPGDKILLRRGDVFRESVRTETKHIELNACGTQDKDLPCISGSVPITGFKPWKGSIYVAKTDANIGYLFVNNKLMTIARYPNTGWLRTKSWEDKRPPRGASSEELRQSNTIVTCPALTEYLRNTPDYWVGANIRWRHHSWWYETRKVTSYDPNGRLSLDDRSFNVIGPFDWDKKGWGFYFDNKLEELDAPGEWFFDPSEKLVYLYPPDGKDPNNVLVEGSVLGTGLSVTDATVKNICFRHQKNVGLEIDGASVIEQCIFEGIGRDAKVSERDAGGAALPARERVTNARISNNIFRNNFNLGISWQQDHDANGSSIIERNIILNTGVVPGYGGSGSWHAVAVLIASGRNVHVQHNRIENSGYAGILLGTEGNFAEFNVIKNAMATLNDGAGIYTNCSRSTIRHNIILDTKGGMESSGSWETIAHGIWPEFLRNYKENVIENNTCAGSGGDGLFLTNNFNCIVRNNVLYNNDRYQLLLTGRGEQQSTDANQNHIIASNVLFAAKIEQGLLYFNPQNNYGTLKDNYFCSPLRDNSICYGQSWPNVGATTCLTIKDWQTGYPWSDKSPKIIAPQLSADPNEETPADNSQLVINDTEHTKTMPINGSWCDLDGNTIAGSVTLEPYSSVVLIRAKSGI